MVTAKTHREKRFRVLGGALALCLLLAAAGLQPGVPGAVGQAPAAPAVPAGDGGDYSLTWYSVAASQEPVAAGGEPVAGGEPAIQEGNPPVAQEQEPVAAAGGYSLSWWTVDAGGAMNVSAGAYTLGATGGQPEAQVVGAGDYTLSGGFWPGGTAWYRGYLPLVSRAGP